MKPLNLTEKQRENMYVMYDQHKYCLYCKEAYGMLFLSSYLSKEDLDADMKLNRINPMMHHSASLKYITEEIGE